jgi:hypothetical protein
MLLMLLLLLLLSGSISQYLGSNSIHDSIMDDRLSLHI